MSDKILGKILVIDDDSLTRTLIKNLLKRQFEIICASSGTEGLNLFKEHRPNIVLLDINLGDSDGISLIKDIMDVDKDAYIIMFSANTSKSEVLEAVNLGAKGFLEKPLSKESLVMYIERCPTISVLDLFLDNGMVETIIQRRIAAPMPRILVVDDDSLTRRIVKNFIQDRYRVIEAGNARNGVKFYVEHAPNAVLLDINMPDFDGIKTLEKMIELDPESYIVMLSNNTSKEKVTTALQLGAKGFIKKPIDKSHINHYLQQCPTLINKQI